MLKDRFDRLHDYLRISLTDKCNFRCSYCMPEEEMQGMPTSHLMQAQEVKEIAKVFVGLGVNKIRLTGGEPLVRKDFHTIADGLSSFPIELTLTTNGALLHHYWDVLKQCRIDSINISIDTLQPNKFLQITRRDQLRQVWENIEMALERQMSVKLNVVAMKGFNEDEICDFVALTRKRPLHIRFIEYMPFDQNGWDAHKVLPTEAMYESIRGRFDCVKLPDKRHDTAKKFKVIGHEGTFAFITTMTQPFCNDCNRMRLTADGKMKNCLFGKDELDLLSGLRNGQPLEPIIRKALFLKHEKMGGQFEGSYLDTSADQVKNRSMIQIGG